jgi:hypothetical protein
VISGDHLSLPDPLIQWTATADGTYRILVGDTLQQGGADHFDVLDVRTPEPKFEVTSSEPAPILLAPRTTTTVKLAIKRLSGHTAPLGARVSRLPAGVRSPEVTIAEKATEAEIQLIAAQNAPPSNLPLTFTVWNQPEPAAKPDQ